MKAAVIRTAGGPANIVIEKRAIPTPPKGWVLVKVKAFGLNRSELMTRKGLSPNVEFPRVLGIECVGEIANDPSREFQKGQKIAAFMGGMGRDFDGSYAEYTVLPKELIIAFTSGLPWEKLGAIPEMFQTVYGSLHRALKIKSNETLLIRGGSSSVGLLAAQLAKNYGVTVVSTTRKKETAPLLLDNGADHVLIDDGNLSVKIKSIFPEGVNNILELIGTKTLRDSLLCASPGGAVCMTGMLSEEWSITDFAPMSYIPATVNLTVYDSGQIRIDGTSLQEFISDVELGKVKLKIGKIFKLDEIADAHTAMDSNSANGKIAVLT